MKNDNLLWGVKRIQGELLKLDISLSTKTIRKILQGFRRRGKIQSSITWRILEEYVGFYNNQRPHQGIQQEIPKAGEPEKAGGAVCMSPILGGLHHHYYRQAA